MFCELDKSAFVDELVSLNTLVPVRHLRFKSTEGSGIAKVPVTEPLDLYLNYHLKNHRLVVT